MPKKRPHHRRSHEVACRKQTRVTRVIQFVLFVAGQAFQYVVNH